MKTTLSSARLSAALLFVLALEASTARPGDDVFFVRGDCDGSGSTIGSPTDAIFLLHYSFLADAEVPPCLAACDANGDGDVLGSVSDAVYTLSFNFLGGPLPPEPFPECGSLTVADAALGCASPPAHCVLER